MADIPERDFRAITRKADVSRSVVMFGRPHDILLRIQCGELEIQKNGNSTWSIGSRFNSGVCDEEHDSAWAFRIDVVGLTLKMVSYGASYFEGVLVGGARDADHVRIARAGYDPVTDPTATVCGECVGDEKHLMIENYVPPVDNVLFDLIRGEPVQITTGIHWLDGE